jgi:uncharacterized protein
MRPRRASRRAGIAPVSAALVLTLILAATVFAGEPKFPPLTGRVVDDASVLSPATQSKLTDMLAEHENATGQQIVVVTLSSLQGIPIEEFGYQLGRHWGIGQKGTNNGVLLIVAPKEHNVRIEVGYGLEGNLTDAICSTIIHQEILPAFRHGDFDTGVLAGTMSILSVLNGETPPKVATQPSDTAAIVVAAMILTFVVLWLLIFYFALRLQTNTRRSGYGGTSWGGGYSGVGWSGGGGGGGFSGGGGSFGGGGASGSW